VLLLHSKSLALKLWLAFQPSGPNLRRSCNRQDGCACAAGAGACVLRGVRAAASQAPPPPPTSPPAPATHPGVAWLRCTSTGNMTPPSTPSPVPSNDSPARRRGTELARTAGAATPAAAPGTRPAPQLTARCRCEPGLRAAPVVAPWSA
jgi:hypothetical protein